VASSLPAQKYPHTLICLTIRNITLKSIKNDHSRFTTSASIHLYAYDAAFTMGAASTYCRVKEVNSDK